MSWFHHGKLPIIGVSYLRNGLIMGNVLYNLLEVNLAICISVRRICHCSASRTMVQDFGNIIAKFILMCSFYEVAILLRCVVSSKNFCLEETTHRDKFRYIIT